MEWLECKGGCARVVCGCGVGVQFAFLGEIGEVVGRQGQGVVLDVEHQAVATHDGLPIGIQLLYSNDERNCM